MLIEIMLSKIFTSTIFMYIYCIFIFLVINFINKTMIILGNILEHIVLFAINAADEIN